MNNIEQKRTKESNMTPFTKRKNKTQKGLHKNQFYEKQILKKM